MQLIELDKTTSGIDPESLSFLRRLTNRLYGSSDFEARASPSLITRSEAELFNLSWPRFAFRVYLLDRSLGFMNIRRLRLLRSRVTLAGRRAGLSEKECSPQIIGPDDSRLDLEKQLPPTRCIADSLLMPPSRTWSGLATTGFRFLTAPQLSVAYDEPKFSGVPYLQQMPLGGGLCAQCACLMVTMLMHRWADGIHGIAEITARVQDSSSLELSLGGMTESLVVSYLESVGLHALKETALDEKGASNAMSTVVVSYVHSGVPVILPVDAKRMRSSDPNSVFSTNHVLEIVGSHVKPTPSDNESASPEGHVVVVIGVLPGPEPKFLLQDSASLPFLLASRQQLEDILFVRPTTSFATEASPTVIAVVPKIVQLSLQTVVVMKNKETEIRLMGVMEIRQNIDYERKYVWADGDETAALDSRYRLARLALHDRQIRVTEVAESTESPFSSWVSACFEIEDHDARALEQHVASLVINNNCFAGWYWVEWDRNASGSHRVFFWNAERRPQLVRDPPLVSGDDRFDGVALWEKFLPLCLTWDANRREWMETWNQLSQLSRSIKRFDGVLRPISELETESVEKFHVGLISSFTQFGYLGARHSWREIEKSASKTACELYVFLKTDADHLQPGIAERAKLSAVELLAKSNSDVALRTRIVEYVSSSVTPTINGFATFVPEITKDPDSKEWADAVEALKGVVRIACELNEQGRTPIQTIELVAGSRVAGVWLARLSRPPVPAELDYFSGENDGSYSDETLARPGAVANLLRDSEAQDRVVQALAEVAKDLGMRMIANGVAFAIELEPGPLYTVHDLGTATALCDRLDQNPLLSKIVGFNLDIAHWRLPHPDVVGRTQDPRALISIVEANGSRAFVLRPQAKRVLRRVVHAHVSGHHPKGHFGDTEINAMDDTQSYGDWLELLRVIQRLQLECPGPLDDGLRYRATISVEYEMAREVGKSAARSIGQLRQLLQDFPSLRTFRAESVIFEAPTE